MRLADARTQHVLVEVGGRLQVRHRVRRVVEAAQLPHRVVAREAAPLHQRLRLRAHGAHCRRGCSQERALRKERCSAYSTLRESYFHTR